MPAGVIQRSGPNERQGDDHQASASKPGRRRGRASAKVAAPAAAGRRRRPARRRCRSARRFFAGSGPDGVRGRPTKAAGYVASSPTPRPAAPTRGSSSTFQPVPRSTPGKVLCGFLGLPVVGEGDRPCSRAGCRPRRGKFTGGLTVRPPANAQLGGLGDRQVLPGFSKHLEVGRTCRWRISSARRSRLPARRECAAFSAAAIAFWRSPRGPRTVRRNLLDHDLALEGEVSCWATWKVVAGPGRGRALASWLPKIVGEAEPRRPLRVIAIGEPSTANPKKVALDDVVTFPSGFGLVERVDARVSRS